MKLDRKLWLTADKEEVVEDGDPRAAFLLGSEGDEVSDEDAKRYGLKPTRKASSAEEKQAEDADNKEAAPAANKARRATKKK